MKDPPVLDTLNPHTLYTYIYSSEILWANFIVKVNSFYMSYLYFIPVFMLCSLEEGTLWTESCPRLRATIATALNLLRVPVLGLFAFCRFSRSSVLRLTPPRWSVHTNDTCILAFDQLSQLQVRPGPNQMRQTPRGGKPLKSHLRAWDRSVCRTQLLRIHPATLYISSKSLRCWCLINLLKK